MPPRGKTKTSDTKRAAIAMGKTAGKTNKQIAAAVGLHEKTVATISRDARTTTLMLRLKEKHEQPLHKAFADMILGLGKNIKKHTKKDDPREFNQTAAILLRVINAGDPPLHRVGDVGSTEGDFTLQELLITMRQVTKKSG